MKQRSSDGGYYYHCDNGGGNIGKVPLWKAKQHVRNLAHNLRRVDGIVCKLTYMKGTSYS